MYRRALISTNVYEYMISSTHLLVLAVVPMKAYTNDFSISSLYSYWFTSHHHPNESPSSGRTDSQCYYHTQQDPELIKRNLFL